MESILDKTEPSRVVLSNTAERVAIQTGNTVKVFNRERWLSTGSQIVTQLVTQVFINHDLEQVELFLNTLLQADALPKGRRGSSAHFYAVRDLARLWTDLDSTGEESELLKKFQAWYETVRSMHVLR